MPAMRSLIDSLGIRLPIIQAPMAGVSSPAMAVAVGQAGGLGSIAVGAVGASGAAAMIAAVREHWAGPLNVNLFCHRPAVADAALEAAWIERFRPAFETFGAEPPTVLREIYQSFLVDDAMLALLLEKRPSVASFHFGLPPEAAVRALRAAGIFLFASVTNLREARRAEAAGMHAVVAQGYEAGGHRGMFDPDGADEQLSTHALTRLLARTLAVPVIAAGGIMDGAGVAAALKLGAAAAQLGTAFVGTDESLADASYRAALEAAVAQAPGQATVMTRAISGRPARGLRNRFTDLGADVAPDIVPTYPVAYDLGKALNAAAKAGGDTGFGAHWAGTGVPRLRCRPARGLMAELAAELAAAMA